MSVNRRSFLRALIGAPFAAKALEAIISKSVAAPVPVVATPEPKWTLPAANDAGRTYTASTPYYETRYPSCAVVRLAHVGEHPVIGGQTVRINAEGQVEPCEPDDPRAFGFATHQTCSSGLPSWQQGRVDWEHNITIETFGLNWEECRRLQYKQWSVEPYAPEKIEVRW